ncbi:MAG: hypothetical protein CENE_02664 [Candidatus Celerinatantimonas neptuna]|nr:MAG: hypothetical protein CENE_02664 [Candidatus Celerinatantimonas neptuna]
MALNKSSLESRIVDEMKKIGATDSGEYSWVRRMAQAFSIAIVDEINANAKANVTSGSSTGQWPIL